MPSSSAILVSSRIRHEARMWCDTNKCLVDVGNDVSEALLEVAVHLFTFRFFQLEGKGGFN